MQWIFKHQISFTDIRQKPCMRWTPKLRCFCTSKKDSRRYTDIRYTVYRTAIPLVSTVINRSPYGIPVFSHQYYDQVYSTFQMGAGSRVFSTKSKEVSIISVYNCCR